MKNILLFLLIYSAFTEIISAQYLETFSTTDKGYKINCVNDFTAMNWTITTWDAAGTCQIADLRDPTDYFNTTAAGVLECIDLDQEVCWESPLINTAAANPISLKMDLSWVGFDVDAVGGTCIGDYIRVYYSVNGGAYTMVPNVKGGNACATVAYLFSGPPGPHDDNVMINVAGITGGSTLKIRVCGFTNANAEKIIIDNVNVPETGVTVGCAAPVLSTVVTQVGCSNPNSGAIDLMVSAGTPGYTYIWSNGATTQDLINKPIGTYTVTVTDAASCSTTTSATITNAPAIVLTTQVLDASCSGNADGEIGLDVSGGVPGYTYDWSNDGAENPDNDAEDLIAVLAGSYTVTVSDASACTATKSVVIGVQPSVAYNEQFNIPNKGYLANFVDDFSAVAWTMTAWSPQPPAPFGRDNADFFRTSGGVLLGEDFDQDICWTSPLVDLNTGTQFSVDLAWTGFDVQVDEYINVKYSIDGGSYVTIPNLIGGGLGTIQYNAGLDQGGSLTVTKTGLSGSTIQIQICAQFNANLESMTIDNVSIPNSKPYCPAPVPSLTPSHVTCNGAANGSITTTVVNGSSPYTFLWSNGATTQNLSGLSPGSYTITVTDQNSLTGTATTSITQPSAIVLNTAQVNVLCNGAATGSIDLSPSGGVPGYTYMWSGGQTTQDLSGLSAGTYTGTVTDENGCTKTNASTITQASLIVLSSTQVNVLCNGASTGSIDLSPSGGVPGYTYMWSGGQTTQDLSGLSAGTYTVTVTDANGCTKTNTSTITQASLIVLSSTQVNVLCNGASTGSIDLTVSGGVSPYTYDWSNDGAENPDNDTQDLNGLASGGYTVTVTDANGCTKTSSTTITEPAFIALSTTQVNVFCNGGSTGSIDLTISGGVTPYTYDWSNDGAENPDNDTQDLSGLQAGGYTVTVTDANNCTNTISATITQPASLVLNSTAVNPSNCFVTDGSIDLSIVGGTGPFTYDWSNDGAENPDNDPQDLLNLAEGTYSVTVTDGNGCTAVHSKTLDYIDVVNPVVSCPSSASRDVNVGTCKYTIVLSEFNSTATDNCGISAPHIYTLSGATTGTNSGSLNGIMLNPGNTNIQWKVTDINGNMKTCSFNVSVTDTELPTITCPPNKSAITSPGQCTAIVDIGSPTGVGDNCGTPTVTNNSPGTFQLGITLVKWKATDGSGNTKTCTQKITVLPYNCGTPIQVYHTDTTATTAKVKWKDGFCAITYELRIRQQITTGVWGSWSDWTEFSGPAGPPTWTHQFEGLTSNKFYHYQLRSQCGTKHSTAVNDWFWTLNSFGETNNRVVQKVETYVNNRNQGISINVELIPNPSREFTTVLISGFEQQNKTVSMFDLFGKLVFRVNIDAHQNQLELDLNTLKVHSGIYLIRVSDDINQITKQLIINR
ncbi:MAG: T9SS type A sorting domain-containing protein [Saprospiraceae bacterium]|nr:T9SS type A sorting domain-containing protein [Saprospiraceae bacterium]